MHAPAAVVVDVVGLVHYSYVYGHGFAQESRILLGRVVLFIIYSVVYISEAGIAGITRRAASGCRHTIHAIPAPEKKLGLVQYIRKGRARRANCAADERLLVRSAFGPHGID